MDELLGEFITEASENLGQLDNDLVALEKDPHNTFLLGNIFRTIHTIKGACGFVGLVRLEEIAHVGETVLGKFRDGEIQVTPQSITYILECVDVINHILEELEKTGKEPQGDDSELVRNLIRVSEAQGVAEGAAPSEETSLQDVIFEKIMKGAKSLEVEEIPAEEFPKINLCAPSLEEGAETPETPVTDQSIRVNISTLENLITTVTELVLTRNELLQLSQKSQEQAIELPLQRLNHVTSELQENVMKTRMQPIGDTWSELPRLVGDLAKDLGKKIDLEMIGAETELDHQVLELIKDPLTHIVRTSADHGLETPEDRHEAGKPATGKITLKAFNAGSHIVVEIVDNGRGMDPQSLKEKILEKGLASPAAVKSMNDNQVFQYIFHAGVSTTETVSNISGRGMGMNVVLNNIEKVGGNVEVRSTAGGGTTFTITIPLTFAIVPSLIVGVHGHSYALPQTSISELVRVSNNSDFKVEYVKKNPVLRLRKKLLQLVFLENLFAPKPPKKLKVKDIYVIVVNVGSYQYGIVVHHVFDTQEIVIKPVSSLLQNIQVYSGSTILGDGSVVLILDPKGIIMEEGESSLTEAESQKEEQEEEQQDLTSLLLFKDKRNKAPKAVPLTQVSRLEKISSQSLEHSNDQWVVQYRDQLMPLFTLDSTPIEPNGEIKNVLVFHNGSKYVGLVVEEIIDIVEEAIELKMGSTTEGIYGSAVIAGKATEVIDMEYQIKKHLDPHGDSTAKKTQSHQNVQVLLVGDSIFFRNILSTLLKMEGYKVTPVSSLESAKKRLEDGRTFDILINDMVNHDRAFFSWIKDISDNHSLPLLVLSSEEDEAQKFQQDHPEVTCIDKSDRRSILHLVETLIEQARSHAA